MALLESYVSDLKNVPPGAEHRVFVMRSRGHDALAPSDELFGDFKARERELKAQGVGPVEAHNRAWDDVEFEKRFREAFAKDPQAIAELRAIQSRARSTDVFLICYEKPPKKCHRFLLLGLAKKL